MKLNVVVNMEQETVKENQQNHPNCLVIGIGNEFRSDDGIGPFIIRKLRRYKLPAVTLLEMSGEGSALMDAWKDFSRVYIFDAVKSGVQPGTVFRFNALEEKIPQYFFNYSTHNFSLAEAIELGRVLENLPPYLIVYGIEGENFGEGKHLSEKVKKAAGTVIGDFLEGLKKIKSEKNYSFDG
ncbi:MAG: hydrogenase maturation protease [Calditrichia bacterium]